MYRKITRWVMINIMRARPVKLASWKVINALDPTPTLVLTFSVRWWINYGKDFPPFKKYALEKVLGYLGSTYTKLDLITEIIAHEEE